MAHNIPVYHGLDEKDRQRLMRNVAAAYGRAVASTRVSIAEEDPGDPPPAKLVEIPEFPELIGIDPSVYRQINAALRADKQHLMFYGPPGTGKTTLSQLVAGTLHDAYTMITGSADWTSQDVIGGYQPVGEGKVQFIPGVLLQNFDRPLIIDELNRCDIDKVIGPLFTVLSGQKTTLPYRTEIGDAGSPAYVILPEPKPGAAAHEFAPKPGWRIIGREVRVAGRQGWLDVQMIITVIALNLCGGDRVEDLERLEADAGFAATMDAVERRLLVRRERRQLKSRFRRGRGRSVPSPSALSGWLERFHDAGQEDLREAGRAFIPRPSAGLLGLRRVNQALVSFLQHHRRQGSATLDMDATLVQSHKRQAEYCYKKFKAYQPLNTWWAEQQVIVHSEFRDGNVPAGYRQLQVLQASLAALPGGVDKVYLRSDTAGYQKDLLLYCGEGRDKVFGVIEFAVGANVTAEFRRAALAVPEAEWRPLDRVFDGQRHETGQEWAEVCHVPSWVGESKTRADYRFLAIREPLEQLELGDGDQFPFPTAAFALRGRSKLFALVTNRDLPGDAVIWWSRERCGKSEEVHAVMKHDLAGGTLPSGLFGANAAWWAIMVLAHNLNAVMKQPVPGPAWVARRMKALRLALIALPGRVIRHARRLIIRLASEAGLDLVLSARRKILALARGPT